MSSCNTATTYTSTLNYRQDTGGTDIVYQGKGICAIHSQMPSQMTLTTNAGSAAGTYVLYFPSTAGLYTGVWANAAGIPANTHVHTIQSTFVQLDTTLATTITTGTPIIFTPALLVFQRSGGQPPPTPMPYQPQTATGLTVRNTLPIPLPILCRWPLLIWGSDKVLSLLTMGRLSTAR